MIDLYAQARDAALLVLHRLDQWLIPYPVWTLWIGAACAFIVLAAGMPRGLIGVAFAHPAPQADTRSLERGALRLQQFDMQFRMDDSDDAAGYPLAGDPDLSPAFRGPGRAELDVDDLTRPVGRLTVPDGSGDGVWFLPEDQDGPYGEIARGHSALLSFLGRQRGNLLGCRLTDQVWIGVCDEHLGAIVGDQFQSVIVRDADAVDHALVNDAAAVVDHQGGTIPRFWCARAPRRA